MKIVLIGMRGSGKSTIGRLLAKRLGIAWIDLDREIERRTGHTPAEIFFNDGEPAFRIAESRALSELTVPDHFILSTGGGTVISEDNRKILRKLIRGNPAGHIVWLQTSSDILLERLSREHRPPITGRPLKDEIEWLQKVREPHYRALCTRSMDTGSGTPDQVTDALVKTLSAK